MRDELLKEFDPKLAEYGVIEYREDLNPDALTDAWLKNETSYIYKVGVLSLIDANKCDWIHLVIGIQRGKDSRVEIIGKLSFTDGENDDPGRVLKRAMRLLYDTHPVFEELFWSILNRQQ